MSSWAKKFDDYVKRGRKVYKKNYKRYNTPRNRSLAYTAVLVFSVVLLLATSVYGGKHASDAYSTDSNAIVTTQQFGKGMTFPVILPGPHATLIVIPFLLIQGHLPFHYTSFTVLNVGLVVATMLGWAFLMIKIFGRKYEVPILILLSSLIFTSVTFSLTLGYDTIRNIEYPIILWFVLIVSRALQNLKYSRKDTVWAAIGTVLFIVVLAGDSFFNYAILLPLLFVIAWYWAQSRKFTAGMAKALGLILASVVGAALLKLVLSKAGIITFNYAFWGQNSIIPVSSLGPSMGIALQQLLQLQGGFIFGQIVDYHAMATFLNFGLLIASIAALVAIIVRSNSYFRARKAIADDNAFVFATMAISYFVVFFIYALSGYAITHSPTGQIISDQNTRYISLMPLISIIGLVWLLKTYYKDYRVFQALLMVVLVVGIVTSHGVVKTAYISGSQQLELVPSRATVNGIIYDLKANHVQTVLADYWYGPVLGFWSDNSINIAAQEGCTLPIPSNFNTYQFTHQKNAKAALLIDRGGLNYAYWQCTDAQIRQLYGAPSKQLEVPGAAPGTQVEIWIY